MHNAVQDQVQRLQALDHTRSFIVQAPAGSGKTELLIQRFLTLLARVDQPESVVAITFTRKAAAEMRHRIVAALKRAAGPQPDEEHQKHTWQLARDALAANNRLGWRLAEHPARLRIQTIDSLCAMLVRQMPWVSRMGAALRPVEDAGYLYSRAARQTVAMLGSERKSTIVTEALSILLAHLDNHVGRIDRLLSTMLGTRDQWMRHVTGKAAPGGLLAELGSSLFQVITEELRNAETLFPARYRSAAAELARFAASNLSDGNRVENLAACADLPGFPGPGPESLPQWLGIAEMFLTRQGSRRKSLTVREGFPATDAGRMAKEQLGEIELNQAAIDSLHGLRSLPPPELDASQWEILDALILLLPLAVDQLRHVFREEGCVDFIEIGIGARAALGPDTAPTELAHALDSSIRHLLIDEFQDTSQSQYDLLVRLIGDWRPGDGRTLFLVGDPMQSIYGFREANVGLFLQARANGIGVMALTALTLEVNFRSTPRIVEWVNGALGEAFPDTEDILTGAVTFERARAFRDNSADSVVRVHPLLAQDPEAEAERVVEIIEEAQNGRPDESIAVLVLARRHLVDIVSALRRNGRRFRAVEIDALGERPVVQDLMALTQALLHPGNRVAWLSILRAPWCGLTLADLEAVAGGDHASAIWDLLRDSRSQERMTPDGRTRIGRVIPLLGEALARRGRLPLRRMVEGIWTELGGPACLENRTELEDALTYLDLLERMQDGLGVPDEQKFADDVARLFAPSDVEASGNLQLMTIHKAKGLEFDTVILPGLGRRTRSEESRLLMWREYHDGDRSRLLLAPIPGVGGDRDPHYAYLRGLEARKRAHENTRLLYVAATRARKCLHLLGHADLVPEDEQLKAPNPGTLLAKIWQTVLPEFAAASKSPQQETGETPGIESKPQGVPLRRLALDWKPLPLPDDVKLARPYPSEESDAPQTHHPVFEWASDLQRIVGVVVHEILQRMRVPERVDFNEEMLRTALRREGLDGDKLDEGVSRSISALRNTIGDDRGRWILSRHEEDEREFAVSTVTGEGVKRYIVDRTFVDEGRRWIIDYKTSAHTGGNLEEFLDNEQRRYHLQLEGYANVIRTMDARPICLGLYFPLLQGWRTWRFDG